MISAKRPRGVSDKCTIFQTHIIKQGKTKQDNSQKIQLPQIKSPELLREMFVSSAPKKLSH